MKGHWAREILKGSMAQLDEQPTNPRVLSSPRPNVASEDVLRKDRRPLEAILVRISSFFMDVFGCPETYQQAVFVANSIQPDGRKSIYQNNPR